MALPFRTLWWIGVTERVVSLYNIDGLKSHRDDERERKDERGDDNDDANGFTQTFWEDNSNAKDDDEGREEEEGVEHGSGSVEDDSKRLEDSFKFY